MNKLFIFVFLLLSFSFINIYTTDLSKENYTGLKKDVQTDVLLNKIFAVHVTKQLPNRKYLPAGFHIPDKDNIPLFPDVRKTLHFALGEMVRPVEDFMNWEDCPYAVVTPLKKLFPQLININCYDTFILGDLILDDQVYLVIPSDEIKDINNSAIIITYDREKQTIREAVDKLIEKLQGWHIEMDSEDIEDSLHPAFLKGSNINTASFFEPLKHEKVGLAIGLRFSPLDGEHYRLSQMEMLLLSFCNEINSKNTKTQQATYLDEKTLQFNREELLQHLSLWSKEMEHYSWNYQSFKAYTEIANEIDYWIFIMDLELHLRNDYKKTLFSAPEPLITLLINKDRKSIKKWVKKNREQLENYSLALPCFDSELYQ
ncbi:hypothetical protein BN1013_01889 [Candidatus Rubidus massiliensis]|nr:hypothetical protein BN1013_01889 [Candidatus Rubidus massiliensis]